MTLKKKTIYAEKVIKQTSAVISKEVKKLIPVIRDYLAGQPVERAYLFGSCARGEEDEKSDIDLLVTYDPTRKVTLFTISRMMLSLQRLVNRPVDIVEESGLKSFAAPSADRDKILIYERKNKYKRE